MRIFLVLFILLCGNRLKAQDTLRGDYRIILQANLGLSKSHINHTTQVDKGEYSSMGLLRTFRAVWRPDHLLGMGIETGILPVSSLTIKQDVTLPTGSTINLKAVPLLLVFSMEKYGIELSSGVGIYNYQVQADIPNKESTVSNQWEIGWMLNVGYCYPLTHSLGIGGDIRHYVIPERSLLLTSLSVKFQWQLWY